jgi:hypothetical protein
MPRVRFEVAFEVATLVSDAAPVDTIARLDPARI